MSKTNETVAVNQTIAAAQTGELVSPKKTTIGAATAAALSSTPVDAAIATAATAEAVEQLQAFEETELPVSEKKKRDNAALEAAAKETLAAFQQLWRGTWGLAKALKKFRDAHIALYGYNQTTDDSLATELRRLIGVKLTGQRVGQILNTYDYYLNQVVDESIDFKVYEVARKANEAQKADERKSKPDLVEFIRKNPRTDLVRPKKQKPERPAARTNEELQLICQMTPDGSKIGVKWFFNGESIRAAQFPNTPKLARLLSRIVEEIEEATRVGYIKAAEKPKAAPAEGMEIIEGEPRA